MSMIVLIYNVCMVFYRPFSKILGRHFKEAMIVSSHAICDL